MIDECDSCGDVVLTASTEDEQICLSCFMDRTYEEDIETEQSGIVVINVEGTEILVCFSCEGTGWVADAYTCPDCTGRGHTVVEVDGPPE